MTATENPATSLTDRSAGTWVPPRSLWLVAVAILVVELAARSPLAFRIPGVVLYPVVLFVAYRHGMRAGLASAALSIGYLTYFFQHFHPTLQAIEGLGGYFGVLTIGIVLGVLAIGLLRDRFDQTLERERAASTAARAAEQQTREILESINDGFMAIDRDWRCTYVNRAAESMLRRPRSDLLGEDVRRALPRELYHAFFEHHREAMEEQRSVHFEESTSSGIWYEVQATPSPSGLTIYFRDITERRQHEDKLRSMTLVDELTGLYNRRGFFTLAEQQVKLAERKHRGLLLVFADLDNLKVINDTFGHTAGDQALFEAAAVLRHTFRETDVVARIGGDEFSALVLETEPDIAPTLLSRLKATLEQTNAEGTLPFELSLSFGLAGFPPDSPRPIDELLSLADHRMYEQKRAKRA